MARVHSIAESIGDVGLMNPPAVCIRNDFALHDGEISDAVPVLIYGHHRLLALKQRGEAAVECIVYDVDDLHAELMEIDENLARSELTPAEESACILRRKQIWDEMNGRVGERNPSTQKATLHKDRPQNQKRFAAEISSVTGDSKTQVNLKIARARELGPDIHRIVGTSLDKGVEMDALMKLPEPERATLISRAEAGEKVSARPVPLEKPLPADQALNVIAKGIVATSHDDVEEEERQFWVFFASLSPQAQKNVIRKFKAMS